MLLFKDAILGTHGVQSGLAGVDFSHKMTVGVFLNIKAPLITFYFLIVSFCKLIIFD